MTQKVLLVDDEAGICKVLGLSLEDRGYEVYTAGDGEEALSIFQDENPPIVLTDIKMPGLDGIELLQLIKEKSPDTEVIMITGHGDIELAIQSLKFDATDFITKPIDDDSLEIALKRAREKISLKTKLREYTENLEALVEEKSRQLLQAERLAAVGETVTGLAHAIKNISGGITGGMYVLEQGIELDNKKYLCQGWDMVKSDVARISHLALDLLSYAKEREPEYRLCDPNLPAREVFALMNTRAGDYGIELTMKLDETIPDIWLDAEGIHRCLLNLVTNAIDSCNDIECKTSPKASMKVELKTSITDDQWVEYQVMDTGCGMDGPTRSKIFQRFFSTKGSQGTGLGLMITKKIIDEHGGKIFFRTKKSSGTTFVIQLPQRSLKMEKQAEPDKPKSKE